MNQKEYLDICDSTYVHDSNVNREILHATLGLVGEAGEVSDIIKKLEFYPPDKHPKDSENKLLLELGDVMYYLTILIDLSGFTWDDVMEANVAKLSKRYPDRNG